MMWCACDESRVRRGGCGAPLTHLLADGAAGALWRSIQHLAAPHCAERGREAGGADGP